MPRTPVALAYPETRYAAPSLPDLASADERKRLSPAALKALFKIARHWKVRDEDIRRLMGGISSGSYYLLKQDPRAAARPLDEDKLLRVSYLIGIFKSLNILYSEKLADQWMQLPNTNPIFAGRTPLQYLLDGGIRAMEVLRRLLDARRGGR